MKVANLISRSLRLLQVINANETPKAKDYETGIETLNSMVSRWEANGIPLGWSPVSAPDDTVPAPDSAHDAIAYHLALRLRPEYGASVDPDVFQTAQSLMADVLRDVYTSQDNSQATNAPTGGRWNIYTDSPGTGYYW